MKICIIEVNPVFKPIRNDSQTKVFDLTRLTCVFSVRIIVLCKIQDYVRARVFVDVMQSIYQSYENSI